MKALSIRSFGFTIPSMTYNFIKNNTDAELLAKPQLRISEGQKAQLIIGDKVPIPTTTFNTGTTVGGNIVPVTSFQYQDVGIKIEVEPRVHHNKEVTLKLTVEVSNLNGFVTVQQGQNQPIIGTRTISSNIRLKDGETNFLAGLLRTDKSNNTDTVPFLGDIPILGRLFSKKNTSNKQSGPRPDPDPAHHPDPGRDRGGPDCRSTSAPTRTSPSRARRASSRPPEAVPSISAASRRRRAGRLPEPR